MTDTLAPPTNVIFTDEELVGQIVEILWQFSLAFTGMRLYPFQEEFGRAMLTSMVGNKGQELTGLISRQAGKTEIMADMITSIMVLLPRLAKIPLYHNLLKKFEMGVLVGLFAPTGEQIQTMFDRIGDRLTSDRAKEVLSDPDIDETVESRVNFYRLKRCRSLVRMSTANERAKIESKTYHLIVIDEAQGVVESVITKSIAPMGATTNATRVMIGTPNTQIGYFYKTIKRNKARMTEKGTGKLHFEYNWKTVAKYNADYGTYVGNEMSSLGEDSDEFRMSYMVEWILDRGMFITVTRLDELGDRTMKRIKRFDGPCYVGIDPARKIDSTVVTIVYADLEKPNENGLYHHRILDWLEMPGEAWEEQYFKIIEFLSNYNVQAVAVDEGGVGDSVVDRLQRLLPSYIDVVAKSSSPKAQSERWKYLLKLVSGSHPDYGSLFAYPAHAEARRTRVWKRFYQQMSELEKKYQGAYILAEASEGAGQHDDYADSAALACCLTLDIEVPEIEFSENFLMRR